MDYNQIVTNNPPSTQQSKVFVAQLVRALVSYIHMCDQIYSGPSKGREFESHRGHSFFFFALSCKLSPILIFLSFFGISCCSAACSTAHSTHTSTSWQINIVVSCTFSVLRSSHYHVGPMLSTSQAPYHTPPFHRPPSIHVSVVLRVYMQPRIQ